MEGTQLAHNMGSLPLYASQRTDVWPPTPLHEERLQLPAAVKNAFTATHAHTLTKVKVPLKIIIGHRTFDFCPMTGLGKVDQISY